MILNFKRFKHLDQVDNQLVRAFPTSAGLDICANKDFMVYPNDSTVITTGIGIELPVIPDSNGFLYQIQVWPRSGLSVKNKIETGAGLCDPEYRGEYKVHLYNPGKQTVVIKKGDRIAQLVVVPFLPVTCVEVEDFSDTDRGEGGFGSTGV